jgi:hypothetical protein
MSQTRSSGQPLQNPTRAGGVYARRDTYRGSPRSALDRLWLILMTCSDCTSPWRLPVRTPLSWVGGGAHSEPMQLVAGLELVRNHTILAALGRALRSRRQLRHSAARGHRERPSEQRLGEREASAANTAGTMQRSDACDGAREQLCLANASHSVERRHPTSLIAASGRALMGVHAMGRRRAVPQHG